MPEPRPISGDDRSSPEVDLLISCTRTRIGKEFSDRIRSAAQKKIDWIALIRLAMCHDVMPLLFQNLQRVCQEYVPHDVFRALETRYHEQEATAQRRAKELVRVLALLKESEIPVVPYKGPALAQRLYGHLSLREFCDLDIMMVEGDLPRAQEVIRRHGYKFAYLKRESQLTKYVRAHRELQFCNADGNMLELHWRFALQRPRVKGDPERFLQRLETVSLAGARVSGLPLEVYFLTLSLHATKHKWKQLKLICDIAEILGQPGLDWQYVLREADALGLKRMLAVGVLLAEDPLEAVAPMELKQGLKIDRAAQALATEVRRSLFKEPGREWHRHADYKFQFEIRERLQDKASAFFWNWWPKLARRFKPMPTWYDDEIAETTR